MLKIMARPRLQSNNLSAPVCTHLVSGIHDNTAKRLINIYCCVDEPVVCLPKNTGGRRVCAVYNYFLRGRAASTMSHATMTTGVPLTFRSLSLWSFDPTSVQVEVVMVCSPRFWSVHGPSCIAYVEVMTPDLTNAGNARVFGFWVAVFSVSSLSNEALRVAVQDFGTPSESISYVSIDRNKALLPTLNRGTSRGSVPCLFYRAQGGSLDRLSAEDVPVLAIRVNTIP